MKKILQFRMLLILAISSIQLNAQFSVTSNAYICYNPSGPNSGTAAVAVPHASATAYTWSVIIAQGTPSCAGTYTASNSSNTAIAISYPCCGIYGVWGQAWNGSNLLATSVATVFVTCPNWLQMQSSNNFVACSGNQLTLYTNNSWSASNFQWSNGSSIGTGTSVVVSPTVNTCYTVTANQAGSGCTGSAVACVTVATSPTVSAFIVSTTTANCIYDPVVLGASGAAGYQWSTSQSGQTVTVYPWTTTSCYVVTGTNTAGCADTAMVCVNVNPGPSLVLSASAYTVCPGSTVTLNASGGTNYTWSAWPSFSSTLPNPTVTVNSQTTYSVVGTNSAGCMSFTNISINVFNTTAIYSTDPYLCLGDSSTLYLGDPGSYTWTAGSSTLGTGQFLPVQPTVTTCYNVTGTSVNGCLVNASMCVTVAPVPVVNISGVSSTCGGSVFLSASGGNSYLWSPGNYSSTGIWVNPTSTTCYTVLGYAGFWGNGCVGQAVHCVTVGTTPIIVTPPSATVCLGTSQTFVASGAITYTWSTSATTSSINVMPTVTTVYTVSGHGSNGCLGITTVTLTVDNTCSDVWPGDANSDGVVGTTDVLEIGLAFLSTGPSRNPGGNNYVAQKCTNWSGTVSSGKNKNHADCNGNGTVSLSDTIAIFNNFAQTHAFRLSGGTDPEIRVVSDAQSFMAGTWNKVDIYAGDEIDLELYGLTFDLGFDNTLIENGEAYLVYTPSFLNNNNQNVEFRKADFANGKIYAASVRTDHADVTGNGKIAEFHFMLKPGTEGQDMAISTGNSIRVDKDGNQTSQEGNDVLVQIIANDVGLGEYKGLRNWKLLPNPASDMIILETTTSDEISYSISDLSGRKLMQGTFRGQVTLSIQDLSAGVYLVNCSSQGLEQTQRLIIEK